MEIKSVNIIGSGNVGSFLAKSLRNQLQVLAVFSRSEEKALKLADQIGCIGLTDLGELPKVDLNIIATSDDAIPAVIQALNKETPVVHTSGTVGLDVLNDFATSGVFYPLQTFTNNREVEAEKIPFLIESTNTAFEKSLVKLCRSNFSQQTIHADSATREHIHLAAVLVNNFTTHLFREAKKILTDKNVDFEILFPLIEETVKKSIELGPEAAQTGPAKRKDTETIQKHLDKLPDGDLKEVYRLMSKLIESQN